MARAVLKQEQPRKLLFKRSIGCTATWEYEKEPGLVWPRKRHHPKHGGQRGAEGEWTKGGATFYFTLTRSRAPGGVLRMRHPKTTGIHGRVAMRWHRASAGRIVPARKCLVFCRAARPGLYKWKLRSHRCLLESLAVRIHYEWLPY